LIVNTNFLYVEAELLNLYIQSKIKLEQRLSVLYIYTIFKHYGFTG